MLAGKLRRLSIPAICAVALASSIIFESRCYHPCRGMQIAANNGIQEVRALFIYMFIGPGRRTSVS
jgi:hypothetical protein